MEYKWYVDTFFISLVLVDLVAMLVALFLLGKAGRVKRCVFAAVCSAVAETFLYVLIPKYMLFRLLMICVVQPLLTAGLLWPFKIKELLSGYLLINALFLVIGGIQTVFLYWLPIENNMTIWNVLMALVAMAGCLLQRHRSRLKDQICQVKLMIQGIEITIQACLDTGNFLRDPYTGKPVSIVNKSVLTGVNIDEIKVRYVPFHTVGSKNELMPVTTIDKMIVSNRRKEIEILRPVIGLAQKNVFRTQDIQMILHREFF